MARLKGTPKREHKNILEIYGRSLSQDVKFAPTATGMDQEDRADAFANTLQIGVENATIIMRSRQG